MGSFVYGVACLVLVALVTFLLVATIVGILVAVPFALAAYLAWAIGAAVASLAIGIGAAGFGAVLRPVLG